MSSKLIEAIAEAIRENDEANYGESMPWYSYESSAAAAIAAYETFESESHTPAFFVEGVHFL